jgi:apolipoprotein N-acyltransferase
VAFVALVPLLAYIDRGARPRAAAACGWLAGLIFFACALAWVPLAGFRGHLLLVVGLYVAVVALAVALWAAGLAWLRRRDRGLFLAAAPVLWVGIEFLRSQGSLGYPWHHLGYALASHPTLIQLAAFGGIYALSLWIATANVALVAARGTSRWAWGAGALLLALPLGLGLRATGPPTGGDTLRIAAVQPHVEQPGRRVQQRFDANLRALIELTEEVMQADPDLLVWPESSFERAVGELGDPFLGALARHYERPLLVGAWRLPPEAPGSVYNAAFLVRPDGGIVPAGDKMHPVPFYEGTPVSSFDRFLSSFGLWPGRFRPGERPGVVHVERRSGDPVPIGILICLDSSYPRLARALRGRGARVLVEISNEAQTGIWSAEQHALVSRLRAVETGVPLVRVANIGPSEWIDARGRLLARIAPGTAAAHAATLPLGGAPAAYVRLGDTPALLAGLLPLLVLALWRLRSHAAAIAEFQPRLLISKRRPPHDTILD